jgi:hypothetical protein
LRELIVTRLYRTPSRPIIHIGLSVASACFAAGCGSSDRRAPASDLSVPDLSDYDSDQGDVRDVVASGQCEDGQVKTCRVYLPAHDGVQPCYVGEQTCADGAWGVCGNAVLVDANDDDAELDPPAEVE